MTRTDSSWGIFNSTDLQFVNSLSNTTTPTNLRFVITAAGNVGIGTAVGVAPSGFTRTLKINTTSGTAGILLSDGDTDRAGFYVDAGTTAPAYLFTNDSKPLILSVAGSPRLTIANTGAATFSSSVGIGGSPTNRLTALASETGTQITTIPVAKFANTGNAFSKVVIGSDNANFDGVISMDNNATLANTKLRFYIGNGVASTAGHSNDQIVLQGNGNVGIGTDSPGTYDSAKIGTSHRFLNVQSSSSAYAVATLAGNQSSADSRIGYLTFVNDNNSSSYKYSAWLGSEVEGSTANQQGGRLIFSTSGDASSAGPIERMRITSAGDIQLPVGNKFIYANPSVGSTTIGAGFNLDAANNRLTLWTNNTEKMRITSDGNLLVNTTTTNPGQNNTTVGYSLINGRFFCNNSGADNILGRNTDGTLISIRRSGEEVGSISVTTLLTSYNTTSDYRLKEDLQEIKGLEKVLSLKVYDYKWKSQDSRMDGVLAHELAEVVPDCVTGAKDAVDEEGNIKPQGIDTSFLVATLTAAIQEMKAIIDAQSARITALENK
jgi:hypothetical protein